MASEERKRFGEIIDSLQESCRTFKEFKKEARKLVLQTKSFAVDTTDYTTDAQDDELEPQDLEELHEEWKNTNKQMEICMQEADTVQDIFNALFEKLKSAQGKALDGSKCGMENTCTSMQKAVLCRAGVGACFAAVATGGLATPFIAGTYLLGGGSIACLLNAVKHAKWGKEFDIIRGKLSELFSLINMRTDAMKKELDDLLHESREMLEKSNSITNPPRLLRSGYFKLRCRRLGEQSERLKARCIQYISHDDEGLLEITGTMNQLSINA